MIDPEQDEAWLLARERGEAVPSHPRAGDYARLGERVAALPKLEAPAGWQQRVLAQIDAAPRRRWTGARAVAIAGVAVAAAVAIWLALQPEEPARPAVAMEIRHGDDVRRGDAVAALGDKLVVRGAARGSALLWLYRDQQRVMSCPGTRCVVADGEIRFEIQLEVPGTYRAVLVHTASVETAGTLAEDLALLARMQIRADTAPPLEVR